MANKIIPKKSSTASKVPLTTDLQVGEIALNLTDKIIYTKDAGGNVIKVGVGDLSKIDGISFSSLTNGDVLTWESATSTWKNKPAAGAPQALATTDSPTFANVTLGSNPSGRGSAVRIGGYNSDGGTGYHGFLSVSNTYGSATNPHKHFRLNSTGNIEIINSAYTATIFRLTDDGVLSAVTMDAGVINTGTIATARLGSGTASSSTYLRGDGTWAAVGSSGTFSDTAFSLTDDGDATKIAKFDAAGITTGTTRTYTLPNINAALAHLGNASQQFTGVVELANASNYIGSSTSNSNLALAGGATLSGNTKTVTIGGAGASGSTTNITIGSAVSGATTNVTMYAVPTLPSQTAATVFAAPNGAAGAPSFRALVAGDIPTLNQNTTGSAATLTTARTLTIGSTGKTFNGSADVSWTTAEIGAQPLDADLTAIAALTGSSGFLKTNGAGTWSVDTNTYLTSASSLDATKLTGTVPTASLGSGTANATTYLRGDGTWATLSVSPNVGTLTFTAANELAHFQSSVNGYNQVVIQNSNAGAAASTDFVVTNNLGTDSTYYGNLGMNSSAFTGSGSFNLANAVYLSATSGDLVLGTTTANAIRFVTNNGTTDAVVISSAGAVSMTGNLTFNGTGQRFSADFSNATLANRLMFQTSTTNGATSIFAIPNGTSTSAAWTAFNGPDPANAGLVQLLAGSGEHQIRVGANGTGTQLPLAFYINNSKLFQIGTAGQWGIGATPDYGTAGQVLMSGGASAAPTWGTPSASDSTKLPLAGGTMTGSLNINQNLYAKVGNAYLSSGGDYMHLATHAWYNGTAWTGDGTAGAIVQIGNAQNFNFQKLTASTTPTFTMLFTVDSSGNATATANVTAYSDERVKTNWRDLPVNFVEMLAGVKHGVYDRTDEEGVTQVGVSAQSLRPVMPHAVLENAEGKLSVAYGNAALTACVALANRVLALEARIATLLD